MSRPSRSGYRRESSTSEYREDSDVDMESRGDEEPTRSSSRVSRQASSNWPQATTYIQASRNRTDSDTSYSNVTNMDRNVQLGTLQQLSQSGRGGIATGGSGGRQPQVTRPPASIPYPPSGATGPSRQLEGSGIRETPIRRSHPRTRGVTIGPRGTNTYGTWTGHAPAAPSRPAPRSRPVSRRPGLDRGSGRGLRTSYLDPRFLDSPQSTQRTRYRRDSDDAGDDISRASSESLIPGYERPYLPERPDQPFTSKSEAKANVAKHLPKWADKGAKESAKRKELAGKARRRQAEDEDEDEEMEDNDDNGNLYED